MRTKKILVGSFFEIMPTILIALISFVKIKFFIGYIGSEMHGYYQIISQIISYLFLIEAGFSSAVIYKLYNPIATQNSDSINQLFSGSLKIFRVIGYIMFFFTILLSLFFIFFVEENSYIIILSFLLISFGYIFEYIFSSKSYYCLYCANQEKYKYAFQETVFKLLLEITSIVIIILMQSILAVAIGTFIIKIMQLIVINRRAKSKFKIIKNYKQYKPDLTPKSMTKDLFWNQVGYLIFNNIDAIIILITPGFGAVYVSIYSAYNYVLKFIVNTYNKFSVTVLHVLGNIAATNNLNDSKSKFNEYNFFCIISAYILSIPFLLGVRSFVGIWIGDTNYILNYMSVLGFSSVLFLSISFSPLTSIISAYGKFKEIKFIPIITSIFNIVCSLILIRIIGIFGILLSTSLSYLLDMLLRSFIISKKIYMGTKKYAYILINLISYSIFVLIAGCLYLVEPIFLNINNYFYFFIYIIVAFIIVALLFLILGAIFLKDIKTVLKKIYRALKGENI